MKKETFKELGKGIINFGNAVGALSVINGLFGKMENEFPSVIIALIVVYIVVSSYIGGIILLEKGSDDA
jgi:hypothetical protein